MLANSTNGTTQGRDGRLVACIRRSRQEPRIPALGNELVRMAEQHMRPDFEAPLAGIETEVARIFATVLDVPGVGRGDNFFHLGGDSLRGVRVLASVEEAFGLKISLDHLFAHPTVAAFAGAIGALRSTNAPN